MECRGMGLGTSPCEMMDGKVSLALMVCLMFGILDFDFGFKM